MLFWNRYTRNSNYGTDYDLNMMTAKGSLPTGTLGYYVKTGTTANKIQGAVNAAQSGDTINVAKGTYKENVKIDKSLTVKGAGSTKTIIDGNQKGTVFLIGTNNHNVDVTLSSMVIQGGTGTSRYINGDLIGGGGIFNDQGTLTVKDCKIIGNSVSGSNNVFAIGGGIFNNGGKIALTGSTISGNSVNAIGDGSALHQAASGGGIYNHVGTVTIQQCMISQNLAKGNKVDANGGGISNFGGLVSISASTISGNSATNNLGSASGGGIWNFGTANVMGSTISGNIANRGGGIANSDTLTVTGSTISGNTAKKSGGGGIRNDGTATLIGSQVSNNKASMNGGGIASNGTVTLTNTIVTKTLQT